MFKTKLTKYFYTKASSRAWESPVELLTSVSMIGRGLRLVRVTEIFRGIQRKTSDECRVFNGEIVKDGDTRRKSLLRKCTAS